MTTDTEGSDPPCVSAADYLVQTAFAAPAQARVSSLVGVSAGTPTTEMLLLPMAAGGSTAAVAAGAPAHVAAAANTPSAIIGHLRKFTDGAQKA